MKIFASWVSIWIWNNSPPNELRWFKRAIEDAKVYYVESLTAQPGNYNQTKVYATIWHETQLGAGLAEFYKRFRAHPKLSLFARLARIRHRYASWSRNEPDLAKSSALMIISSCRHGLRAPIAA